MYCENCGKFMHDSLQKCSLCGHDRERSRISITALTLAGIAAVVSVGASLLDFMPRDKPISLNPQESPTLLAVSMSPSPRASPLTKPTPKPRQTPDLSNDLKQTPTLTNPDAGALLSYRYASGRIVFRWKPLAGSKADKYKIEVEYGNLSHQPPWLLREIETPWNYCTVEFTDVRTMEFVGRWRVTSIFVDGRSGIPTDWRTFQFTK